jgi:hypothetical protein
LLYKCKWCGNSYKRAIGTRANIFKHRDGDKNQSPCPGQGDAISSGATLPITVKDFEAQKQVQQAGIMNKFVDKVVFDIKTLNQVLVMWLVWSSLPRMQIDDFLLGVAFNYS